MAWRRGQAYGQDLRERVLGAWELSVRAAAVRFAVSPSYVAKVRGRLRRTGDTAPGPQRNHVPPRLAPLAEALRARVAAGADATLAELRAWVLAEHGVRVSQPVMWKALARLDLTLKKTAARRRAGPPRRGRGAPRLGRTDARARAPPRRHRGGRQPRQPQGRRRARGDRGARGVAALPSSVQPRPEPDRTRLQQVQAPAPRRRRPNRGRPVRRHWRSPRPLHARRMRELSPPLRLCTVRAIRV